ncbi:peptidoglycan editing factor PgeF [Wenzhouxiangella sp. XN24]|uniref:peptidoglycan editing factor PgeF n=1 Tax=Wenzhouxiangella sp. XN24 TaxID=2713569 RepID=UPI0013EBB2EB|nr:peptidoglycan editing factor PgeF [Wenzhouxiangella sp. XN24]NGX15249.1 peptidoglycan editing factor PgeF [Wenzhouxiangella sp. XN24]
MSPAWIVPDWPAPANVHAASTLRVGGVSPPPWHALNLGTHVGDDEARVAENRRLLALALGLPAEPAWLEQVHGRTVLQLDAETLPAVRVADAAVTSRPERVLAVLTADCLPVLLCREDGTRIGVAHAGWRGLAGGVLEAGCAAMDTPPGELLAWIGPGIGAAAYEVGPEVRAACLDADPGAEAGFMPGRPGHWQCDLAYLARRRLEALGLAGVHGGHWCTHADAGRFFSHRRDGAQHPTGRMATLIWRG